MAAIPEPRYDVEGRLIALETRLDTLLPTLAKKEDLISLEVRLNRQIISLHRWMGAYSLTLLLALLTVAAHLYHQQDNINQRIDRVEQRMDRVEQRMERLEQKLDQLTALVQQLPKH